MDSNHREGSWFYWISAGRMALLVLLLGASYFLPGQSHFPPENFIRLSWVLGAAFLVSAASNWWYKQQGLCPRLVWFQTITDVILVTLAVKWSGGPNSPFTFLYPLVIITACLLKREGGGSLAALLSTLAYGAICIWARPLGIQLLDLAFNFFVNMAAFNATALLGTALARRLSHAEERLSQVQVDLNRMEQLHRLVANSLSAGLITGDEEGRITSFNRAAEDLLGVNLSEHYGRDLSTVWKEGAELLGRLSEDPGAKRAEINYTTREGEKRLFGISTFLLRDDMNRHLGYGMIFQDITDIKAREEQRQRRERLAALGEMAAGLAHEIRNPLASMSGAAQFLNESGMVLPEGERLLQIIVREAARLNQLTESFLKYARPNVGKPQEIKLVHAIRAVAEELIPEERRDSLSVTLDVPDHLEVCFDPEQLKQVLTQVLQNACEAVGKKGSIHIQAEDTGDRMELVILDDGQGIDPEDMPKIFNPFFTTRPDGTGLGLSVAHQIIKTWGGEIFVESEPGKGCKVTITIPNSFLCPLP